MGSHCLWLLEALLSAMHLKSGMRVLDMGCGKAISSIFLAKECNSQVWATDLWVSASNNWSRVQAMGVEDHVFPIHADAKELPFADDFFDAMVSINSLFFYAAEETFLKEHILRNVKPRGEIDLILPCFLREYQDGIPEKLKPYWANELNQWHTLDWWVNHLEQSGMVDIVLADHLPDQEGSRIYQRSSCMFNDHEMPFNILASDNISFVRIVAVRKQTI